eukprot:TRINITY_DN2909_c0_g1_i7.p1 TRINITY_DN2909_c0_g1~~TRINITY_DN2909_c0_g1_i7.p1  ORF type:complete len:500 (-),score=122.83 TRINITY_DN2909_c0_g1_i7:598-2097(-)
MGSSVSMADSFCPGLWDHQSSQNLGFSEHNIQSGTSTSNGVVLGNLGPGSSRSGIEKPLDMGWNLPNSMSKGGVFMHTGAGILPQSFSQFPPDSAFIERAARFSCFGGGSFSDMMSPFSIPDSLGPYSKSGGINAPELFSASGLKLASGVPSQKNESRMADVAKGVSVMVDSGAAEGSPMKSERETESIMRPTDEGKYAIGGRSNESDEVEISGGGQEEQSVMENAVGEPSAKGLGAKKRKRNGQVVELDQINGGPLLSVEHTKENVDIKQKDEQNPTSATTKPSGKHGKESAQSPDAAKEDYIHVRARRGQATNSHSLAERVRREKISERMKFLQDLVPGCSKVTGKAVMLDEIINYVQSLQRQVEFLSMKLATVNPRLDFNLEGLLSKDIIHSRGSVSSTIGFTPDVSMAHPQLHPSQHGLIQAGIPGLGNQSDALRRSIASQLVAMNGYKEPTPQMPNIWDDELNGVVQMSFGANAPFNTQELNEPLPPGHMKVEL